MSEPIKIILKRKSIPVVVDFCLDESIEFSVKPQAFPDTDWELILIMKDIKSAVMAGMFLRENRIDIAGTEQQKLKKQPVKKAKEEEEKIADQDVAESTMEENEAKQLF